MAGMARLTPLRAGICLLIALTLTHAALFTLDADARFFLGDSQSYLHAALSGWMPPDRSYLYPLLIRWLVLPFQSLPALLLWQGAAVIAIAMMAFGMLVRSFRIEPVLAAIAAFVIGIGPELLFYERMMMAESFGMLALVGMLAAACAYLRHANPAWLLLLAVLSLAVVCLRMSLLPVALCMLPLPPLLRWLSAGSGWRGAGRMLIHVALVCSIAAAAHFSYRHWYGLANQVYPDYIATSGSFRLSLVLPLLTADDLRDTGLPEDFLARYPTIQDPRARESHQWSESGFIAGLTDVLGIEGRERVAREVAGRVLRRDPLGLVGLGLTTTSDYFDAEVTHVRMQDDFGSRALPTDMVRDLQIHLGYAGDGSVPAPGPVARAFVASGPWLTFCLFALAPLSLLMAVLGRVASERRAAVALLGLVSLGLVAGQVVFSHIVSFRYLLPFPFFVWMNLAVIVALVRSRRRGRTLPSG